MTLEEVSKIVGDEPYNAQQKHTELLTLLERLDQLKPRRILEIGVYKGGTIKAWTYVATPDAVIVGVDLPDGNYGGGFNSKEEAHILNLSQQNQTIRLLAMDSTKPETIKEVSKYAGFDFIFIDGDHRYEGVKQDYDNYLPMLNRGGIMAFHDIIVHTGRPDITVYKLWDEIKEKHQTFEMVDPDFPTDSGVWGGIGALIK